MTDDSANTELCCRPGDITVTKIPSGYLIGRALDPRGPGPWWEFVATTSAYDEAARRAMELARLSAVRAWLQEEGSNYKPLKAAEPPS